MHIAVDKGANPGETLITYIEHLTRAGYVPPDGRGWVDIRRKGNEANHEIQIQLTTRNDAEELIVFTEMLLKFRL